MLIFRYWYEDGQGKPYSKEFDINQVLNGEPFEVLENEPLKKNHKMLQDDPDRYTGLDDANSNKIFENDIVTGTAKAEIGEYFEFRAVVKWDVDDAGFFYETDIDKWPHVKPWFSRDVVRIGGVK